MSNQYLTFDVTKSNKKQQLIIGRQGDSQLKFVSILFWDGEKNIPYDLTGKQVVFEALKPDNTHIVDYEGITILNAKGGLARYAFNEQVFAAAGTMQQAFFKITQTDSKNNVVTDSTLEISIKVLENKIEFGINSEDYLSEYDRLVAEVEKKFDDYADDVQDNIDKVNVLSQQITDNNIVKATDFNAYKSNVGEFSGHSHDNLYFNDEITEVGGAIPDYYVDKLNSIASSIPDGRFNVGFLTDLHYQNYSYSPNALSHYANIAALSRRVKMNAIISGGDNINGDNNKQSKLWQTQNITNALKYRQSEDTDVFFIFGNHDSGIGQTADAGKGVNLSVADNLSEYELKKLLGTTSNEYGEVRNGDSLYGYKDYKDNKVRLIFLNSFDLPFTSTNGVYDYSFLTQSGFQNEQLSWLANTALKLPDNTWQVMFFSHAPLSGSFGNDSNGNGIAQYNTDALIGLINALQSGNQYTINDSRRKLPINLTADFREQGEVKVIAFVSGHIHQDGQMTYRGINCIETMCSWATLGDANRTPHTPNEDAWDLFSVDVKNKHIYIKRFGYGEDREFSY